MINDVSVPRCTREGFSVWYMTTSLVGGTLSKFDTMQFSYVCPRRFETSYRGLILTETVLDMQAQLVKWKAWMRGLLVQGGLRGAHDAAAGLV